MSGARVGSGELATALAANTATPRTFELRGAKHVTLQVTTAGANPITALTLSTSPQGVAYTLDADVNVQLAALMPLAQGSSAQVRLADLGEGYVRLTLTSTLGTTYDLEWLGK